MAQQKINQNQILPYRLGKSSITSAATSTSALATPAEVSGLAVTFTLTETRTVRAELVAQSWYNSGTTGYNRLYLCNGTVSTANQFSIQNCSYTTANQELPVSLKGELTLSPGTYTFRVGLARSAGTATMSASSTSPAYFTVDIVE